MPTPMPSPLPHWTLYGRLARSLTLGLALCWLVAVALATMAVRFELNEVFDSVLQETAQHLLPDILREHAAALAVPTNGEVAATLPAVPHDEYITYQILTAAGALRLRSHQAPLQPYLLPPASGFGWDATGRRIYTEASVDGRYVIQIAEPAGHRRHTLVQATLLLLLPLAMLLPVAAWLIRHTVRRGMRPLLAVQQELAARGGGNLQPLTLATLPAELALLVGDVNLLMRRLAQALENERAFAANGAHELRTPVAAALAQTQVLAALLGETTPHGARALAIAAELRRLGRLAERLLQLSRAEGGAALAGRTVDLMPMIRLLLEEIGYLPGATARLCFQPGEVESFRVRGDLDAFGIAIRNLLENAVLHGDLAAPVVLRLGPGATPGANSGRTSGLWLSVSNGGAVVPAAQLQQLKQPFHRLDPQLGGSGLGLAIVEAIMHQAGGALELCSPARGQQAGFEAVLHFQPAMEDTKPATT